MFVNKIINIRKITYFKIRTSKYIKIIAQYNSVIDFYIKKHEMKSNFEVKM